jgi:hypothetical protein
MHRAASQVDGGLSLGSSLKEDPELLWPGSAWGPCQKKVHDPPFGAVRPKG